MYVEDVILLAGGFKYEADQTEATINRPKIDPINERLTERFKISLDKDYLLGLKDTPDNGFILGNKDVISIKKQEGYFEAERISVKGEVVYPQSVVLEFRNSNLGDILEACDGLTKYANLKASYLTRDGNIVALDLSKVRNSDKIFENGDELFIASNKGEVQVTGAVQNPSNFIWEKIIQIYKWAPLVIFLNFFLFYFVFLYLPPINIFGNQNIIIYKNGDKSVHLLISTILMFLYTEKYSRKWLIANTILIVINFLITFIQPENIFSDMMLFK